MSHQPTFDDEMLESRAALDAAMRNVRTNARSLAGTVASLGRRNSAPRVASRPAPLESFEDPADVKPPILLVEDDPLMKSAYSRALSDFSPVFAPTLAGARAALTDRWALVVVDLLLPDGDGAEFVHELLTSGYPGKVAIVSGLPEAEIRERLGAMMKNPRVFVISKDEHPNTVAAVSEIARRRG